MEYQDSKFDEAMSHPEHSELKAGHPPASNETDIFLFDLLSQCHRLVLNISAFAFMFAVKVGGRRVPIPVPGHQEE